MTPEPIMDVYDAANDVTDSSHHLRDIARSLYRVGLKDLSDEIDGIAASVHAAADRVRRGLALDGRQRLDRSMTETGETLALLLKKATTAQ